MTVVQAAFRNIVNTEVARQATDRINDSIATAVQETFMDAFHLPTDSEVSREKLTVNGLTDVSISQAKESG